MKKLPLVLALVIAMMLALTTLSLAQTINGCYDKKGNLRILIDSSQCSKNETFISWNQTGTSFDVSRLYTITSHHDIAKCNNDDVAISCTAECSTHPDFPSPPRDFPLYGVPEEVINFVFGLNIDPEGPYTYEDHQPGACICKCTVPFGPGVPVSGVGTYDANVRVVCIPRH